MFIEVLPPGGKPVLELLGRLAQGFYLAGGTGLALQIGHRISGDLDFFRAEAFEPQILKDRLAATGRFTIVSEAEGTIHGVLADTKVSFLRYVYPLLFPTRQLAGVEIADPRDIALMKITAISSRGSKKDFVDLYFICQEYPLDLLLNLFKEKYKSIDYSMYHILRSLAFFDDADHEPDPLMLKPWDWQAIKKYFGEKAVKAMKDL